MANQKVLVVEDDEPIRQLYTFKLSQRGFIVFSATNGVDGLMVAEKERPHLILLDLLMPIMSGDKMLEEIRKNDWGSVMRVIMLTNISKSEAPHTLRFLHVDRYITKVHYTPLQVADLVAEVLS